MSLKGRTEIEGFSRYEPGKFHKVSIKTSEKLPYRASTAILVMFHHGLSLSLSLSMSMTAPSDRLTAGEQRVRQNERTNKSQPGTVDDWKKNTAGVHEGCVYRVTVQTLALKLGPDEC